MALDGSPSVPGELDQAPTVRPDILFPHPDGKLIEAYTLKTAYIFERK